MIQCNYSINRCSIESYGNAIAVVFNMGLFVFVIYKGNLINETEVRRPQRTAVLCFIIIFVINFQIKHCFNLSSHFVYDCLISLIVLQHFCAMQCSICSAQC